MKRQQATKITAIVGNPPYSIGQNNANDDNQNISYSKLEESIDKTYAKNSNSSLLKSLYDSYIKAFRWASDRIKDKGVVAFVSNGSFIDSSSTDGFRYSLYKEFNYIYVFNLRGDQRTVGEKSRREGGKIFGSGSRTPIAITVLVKDGSENHKVYYKDIGDYLNREQKLSIISEFDSISNVDWQEIIPDENNDWINQRDTDYDKYIPMEGGYFKDKAIGVSTNRDEWVYGFNKDALTEKINRMVNNYNGEVRRIAKIKEKSKRLASKNVSDDFVKWSAKLDKMLVIGEKIKLDANSIKLSMYRPFNKKYLYYQNEIIERPGRFKKVFGDENLVICVTGKGASREFSALISDCIPNLDMMEKGQGFYFKNNANKELALFTDNINVTDEITSMLQLSAEDVFYYVYGILHSAEYKEKYVNELRKGLPHIPIVKDKEKFVEIGRQLADLHLNYEVLDALNSVVVQIDDDATFKVTSMKHPKRSEKSTIIYNSGIRITNIPDKAYEYVVNGKSAIQWIMEQYSVPKKTKSGNIDDPNLYSDNPRYILNLLLSVINLSVQTVDLVNSLPSLTIIE